MGAQVIPLDNTPNQVFQTSLSINGINKTLQFNIRFNEEAGYWALTISDVQTGTVLLDSTPLLTGAFPSGNILAQFGYLGIGSAYIVKTGSLPIDYPDDTSLGSDFILIWDDNQ